MEDITISVSLDTYVTILEARKEQIEKNFGWTIPPLVWNYFIEMLYDGCIPRDTEPSIVVDNIAVNGDYGYIADYVDEDETIESVRKCAKEEALAYFSEEDYVIWSL